MADGLGCSLTNPNCLGLSKAGHSNLQIKKSDKTENIYERDIWNTVEKQSQILPESGRVVRPAIWPRQLFANNRKCTELVLDRRPVM